MPLKPYKAPRGVCAIAAKEPDKANVCAQGSRRAHVCCHKNAKRVCFVLLQFQQSPCKHRRNSVRGVSNETRSREQGKSAWLDVMKLRAAGLFFPRAVRWVRAHSQFHWAASESPRRRGAGRGPILNHTFIFLGGWGSLHFFLLAWNWILLIIYYYGIMCASHKTCRNEPISARKRTAITFVFH